LTGEEAVRYLNKTLQSDSEKEFYEALINPQLGISHLIDNFAIPLYFEEMKIDRNESKVGYSSFISKF
jgi:hypothetical protein